MKTATFDMLLSPLLVQDPPRVWSLLVTVFGDLAQSGDSFVSSSVLNAIAAHVGLKPEATRVALHRLRKDGWIKGHRTGRRSSYALTAQGLRQSAAASPIIYRDAPATQNAWLVLRDPQAEADPGRADVWLSGGVGITSKDPSHSDDLTTGLAATDRVPDWVADRICPTALKCSADAFHQRLRRFYQVMQRRGVLSPVQVAVLRVLIVHDWRRIVLRTPNLPDHLFPADWKGADCRALVAACLTQMPRPTLEALNKDASVQHAA
jgi:phenylacetic acid degradation operon negative regulatory protein